MKQQERSLSHEGTGQNIEPSLPRLSRRHLLRHGGLLSLGLTSAGLGGSSALAACSTGSSNSSSTTSKPTNPSLIRVATVVTPYESGLLPALFDTFKKQAPYQIQVTALKDVYSPARGGKIDLVISHYGHTDVHTFVLDGYGEWPLTVFSNQLALVGSPADSARIRGLTNAVQAFKQIAQAHAPYIVNNSPGLVYLTDILWDAAGQPAKGSWYVDQGVQGGKAMQLAAQKQGYALWGVTPFLKFQQQSPVNLLPLVLGDPILQRLMVAIVVNPQKVSGVNETGARALQQFLLSPAAQAQIRLFRVAGIDQELWWPAGRNNEDASE
jgi:tungstate transport system substrate-binding protein